MSKVSAKFPQYPERGGFVHGSDIQTDRMFCHSSPDTFVLWDHPLRPIRTMAKTAPANLYSEFGAMYSHTGHPPVPPEKLLKALLLQAFYSMRSIRPNDDDPKRPTSKSDAVDFKGQKRKNDPHASKTDPHARLCGKGFRPAVRAVQQ